MSCGVGCRRGSDLALLWLWCRPAATVLIGPLTCKPPYATGAALKKDKKGQKKTTLPPSISQTFIFIVIPLRKISDTFVLITPLMKTPDHRYTLWIIYSMYFCALYMSKFFFFCLLSFQGHIRGIWMFPGQRSNQSCSCRPTPQPQPHPHQI